MRRYFNLNIKHPVYEDERHGPTRTAGAAAHWLGAKKQAVIFFGPCTVQEIQASGKPHEALNFVQLGARAKEYSSSFISTIQNGKIWIYRPAGPAFNEERIAFQRQRNPDEELDIPKSMPVEMLPGFPRNLSEVPLILASMKVNLAFSRKTFREISREKYNGNVAAIQAVTKSWEPGFLVDPLDCLSSIELETLVAKLFEATGCFVPAYKGGFLAGIDLFVTTRSRIELAGLVLDPSNSGNGRATWSIQIKLSAANDVSLKDWLDDSPKHLLITLDPGPITDQSSSVNQQFGREWIRSAVAQSPSVHEWLAESLRWLPAKNQSQPLKSKARAG